MNIGTTDVPWQIPAVIALFVVIAAIGLGLAGYKLHGRDNTILLGIGKMEDSANDDPTANVATAICGALNTNWNFGSAHILETKNTCDNFCRAKEDTHLCTGMVSINMKTRAVAQRNCSDNVEDGHLAQGTAYCCCI